ncbi:MAG: ABC transporter substrate-binding protein [Chloroflexi bacterium]|nr:ABC transporter substrate-binding protein [Chloroflexota bacterium]
MINNYHPLARLILLFLLIAAVLILSGCNVEAAPKVYRVGILSGIDFFATTVDGFKAKMTELGYVEGQNIVYDIQKTNFDPPTEERILKKFVADKVDLIFVFPTEASLAAKAATQGTNIPVLFAHAFVEGNTLVESVRQPGGNITGVRFPGPDIAVKRLEILHELVPQAKRVWAAYQRDYPSVPPVLEVLRPAAASLGVTLVEVPATSAADIQADLQARAKSADIDIDAILFLPEPLTVAPDAFPVITKFAVEHKVPIAGPLISAEGSGIVFGNLSDSVEVGKLAAPLADKIFKGIPAGTIPVVSPESHLRINYKVAQELGLTVPEGLLSQADEIIR